MRFPPFPACLLLFAALFFGAAPAALAQEEEPVLESREIETRTGPAEDADIEARITGIFGEIGELSAVTVTVREGVVVLGGDAPSEAAITRAGRLAARLAGVVTVENRIERTLDVESSVSPVLGDLAASTTRLLRAWPVYLIALAVFVLIAGFGFVITWPERLWLRLAPNPFIGGLMRQFIRILFIVIALVTALSLLGAVALLGTLAGGAGLAGIAIGFAVRDAIENYIASIMLSLRQPFRANDHVVINDREGVVIRLTSRATILMTMDGNHLRIPNADVFKAVILNYTRNPERRFEFTLGVDADDDPIDAIEIGLEAIRRQDFVLAEPEPAAIVEAVGDSNIVLRYMAWINQRDTDFMKARSLSIRATKMVLEEHGFSLPEPIYRLRIAEMPELGLAAGDRATVTTRPPADAAQLPERSAKPKASAEAFDVTPEKHLEEKVETERASGEGQDLLDEDRPVE